MEGRKVADCSCVDSEVFVEDSRDLCFCVLILPLTKSLQPLLAASEAYGTEEKKSSIEYLNSARQRKTSKKSLGGP